MRRAPLAYPPGVFRAAEVILVARFGQPAALALALALPLATGLSAIALMAQIASVGNIERFAVQTLWFGGRLHWRTRKIESAQGKKTRLALKKSGRKKSEENEEDKKSAVLKRTKKIDPPLRISNRRLYPVFRTPLAAISR
ncbi:MAG: hypothetical protein WB507_08255 [Solirubrobacterales bacterium]